MWFDADLCFQASSPLADGIGIVCRVCNDRPYIAALESFQQFFSQGSVAALAIGQAEVDQPAVLSRDRVKLRCQPTTGTSQAASFVGIIFFSDG